MDKIFTRQCFQLGAIQPGDVFLVRYHASRPGKSIIWRPIPTRWWLIISFTWLSSILGLTFLSITFSLCFLWVGLFLLRANLRAGYRGYVIFCAITAFVAGMMIFAFGFISIINSGFLSQNFLWVLWNHQVLLGP